MVSAGIQYNCGLSHGMRQEGIKGASAGPQTHPHMSCGMGTKLPELMQQNLTF